MSATSGASFDGAAAAKAYSSTSMDGDTTSCTSTVSGDITSWVDMGSPAGWGLCMPLTPSCRVKNTFIDGFEGDDNEEEGFMVRSVRSMPARCHAYSMTRENSWRMPALQEKDPYLLSAIPTEDGLPLQPAYGFSSCEATDDPWQLPQYPIRMQEQERLPPSQPDYYWTKEQSQQDWRRHHPVKQEVHQSQRWSDEPVPAERLSRQQQKRQQQQQQKPSEPRKPAGPNVVPIDRRVPEMSAGAEAHEAGDCKPCAWFWRPQGCSNGAACRHCHLCGVGEVRQRRKQKQAAARKVEGACQVTAEEQWA